MTSTQSDPSATKILVTGGTGFIGGRLVEKLILTNRATVRVLVHDFARAWRLARLPVEMIQGDLADPQQVRKTDAKLLHAKNSEVQFSRLDF